MTECDRSITRLTTRDLRYPIGEICILSDRLCFFLWSGCVARIWRGFKYFELAGISVPQLHSSSASCPEENMNQRRGIRKANNSGDRGVPRLAGTVLLWITAVLAMATLPTT